MAMAGLGTVLSPYIVVTPQDLDDIRLKLTSHYELGNDIDMSEWGDFTPIGYQTNGTAVGFTGSLNGNGYTISNLTVVGEVITISHSVGLFAYGNAGSKFESIRFNNAHVSISSKLITNPMQVGVLCGNTINANFSNIAVENSVIDVGTFTVGGVGGLTGRHRRLSVSPLHNMENCYSRVTILTSNIKNTGFGGLIGDLFSNDSIVKNCYASTSFSGDYIKGRRNPIVGILPANNIVSGLTGIVYDLTAFPEVINDGFSSGLTNPELKDATNPAFVDWDTEIWGWNGGYPYLKVFGEPEVPPEGNKLTVKLSSEIEALTSSLSSLKRKVVTSVTLTQPISSNAYKQAVAIVESMIEDIVSSVRVSKGFTVGTHIKGVDSNIYRSVRATRNVGSEIQPIEIVTDIIIPFDIEKPIYAEVFILVNQSTLCQFESKTTMYQKNNESISFIKCSQTETMKKENATETSVM